MTTPEHPSEDGRLDAQALGAVAAGLFLAVPQLDPPVSLKARVMAITGDQAVSTACRDHSPDAAGARAAYFVSDFATNQSLSQTIGPLAAGM